MMKAIKFDYVLPYAEIQPRHSDRGAKTRNYDILGKGWAKAKLAENGPVCWNTFAALFRNNRALQHAAL